MSCMNYPKNEFNCELDKYDTIDDCEYVTLYTILGIYYLEIVSNYFQIVIGGKENDMLILLDIIYSI